MQKSINWKVHFIELIIVIFGISVAFWLNNLATDRNERRLEKAFIADLRTELRVDSARLDHHVEFNQKKVALLSKGLQSIYKDAAMSRVDSALYYTQQVGHYDFFFPENFTLTSMLQSGDLKLIRSAAIKKELVRLQRKYEYIEWVQNNFLKALDDNFFPVFMQKIDTQSGKIDDPQYLYSTGNRNFIKFAISDTKTHIHEYRLAAEQIQHLLELTDGY